MWRPLCMLVAVASACSASVAPQAVGEVPVPAQVTISILPTEARLDACGRQAFTAAVANATDAGVTWEVAEGAGGTVVAGLYVAPVTAGVFHVVARSTADPSRTAQATVTVGPERVLAVAVNPPTSTLGTDEVASFTATLTTTCGTVLSR